jgi:hypothetical protein
LAPFRLQCIFPFFIRGATTKSLALSVSPLPDHGAALAQGFIVTEAVPVPLQVGQQPLSTLPRPLIGRRAEFDQLPRLLDGTPLQPLVDARRGAERPLPVSEHFAGACFHLHPQMPRVQQRPAPDQRTHGRTPTPRTVTWWLLRRPDPLTAEHATFLEQVQERCPVIQQAREWVQEFFRITQKREGASLNAWV